MRDVLIHHIAVCITNCIILVYILVCIQAFRCVCIIDIHLLYTKEMLLCIFKA